MLKKSLALLLVLAMTAGVLVGCGGNHNFNGLNTDVFIPDIENYETPNLNGETLELYMPDNTDFEAAGCYTVQAISKALNVNLVVHELDSFDEQYNPMLAEGVIPSLTHGNSWTRQWRQLGEEGAFINIYDYLDAMPHVKAYLEQTEAGKEFVRDFSNNPGELYCVPYIQSGSATCYGYLYRQDIFEANDMEFPTTQDEFDNTLRKLKRLYPESYPFVLRGLASNMGDLSTWGHTWGIGHLSFGVYNSIFTLQNGQYIYAPTTDTYKEIIVYLRELMSKGLLHPSCFTMDTSGWTEAFASNTSFVGFDKMDRLPALNLAGTEVDPNFRLLGTSAFPMGENGRAETQYVGGVDRYYCIGNNDQLPTTLQYIDWLYSEEGVAVTNWGIEGESYYVDEDGNKQIIAEFVNQLGSYNATGLSMPGLAGYKDFNSYLSACDEEMRQSIAMCAQKATADPQVLLNYAQEDQLVIDTYAVSCQTYATAQLAKFVIGQRDLSEWNQYLSELDTKYHLQEMKKAHETAYQAALKR